MERGPDPLVLSLQVVVQLAEICNALLVTRGLFLLSRLLFFTRRLLRTGTLTIVSVADATVVFAMKNRDIVHAILLTQMITF